MLLRMPYFRASLAIVVAIGALLGGAGGAVSVPASSASGRSSGLVDATRAIRMPPTTGDFDYQLGGPYHPARGVTVVTRDSTSRPAKGIYSICYVNGFQTQPGSTWPNTLILKNKAGTPLVDPGWPDERIIDISTKAKRAAASKRINAIVDRCAKRGFAAVEFDNLDSYSRSKGALRLSHAVAFAKLLVAHAHAKGLAASQKNTSELGTRGKTTIGFDFVTTEECDRYTECASFTKVYGKHVLDIEYTDDLRGTFAQVCARKATPARTTLRDRDLTVPSDPAHVYKSC
jgi:hypothetical protein